MYLGQHHKEAACNGLGACATSWGTCRIVLHACMCVGWAFAVAGVGRRACTEVSTYPSRATECSPGLYAGCIPDEVCADCVVERRSSPCQQRRSRVGGGHHAKPRMRVCERLHVSTSFFRNPADVRALSRSRDVARKASTCVFFPLVVRRGARSRVLRDAHKSCGSKRRRRTRIEVRMEWSINSKGPDVPAGELPKGGSFGRLSERGRRRTCAP